MNKEQRLLESLQAMHREVLALMHSNAAVMGILVDNLNPAIKEALGQEMDVEVKNKLIYGSRDFLLKYTEAHNQLKETVNVSIAILEDAESF